MLLQTHKCVHDTVKVDIISNPLKYFLEFHTYFSRNFAYGPDQNDCLSKDVLGHLNLT